MVLVEEIIGDDLVIVVRSVRKGAAAVAVTQRPDAGHVRLQLIINDDVAVRVDGNFRPVKTQVVRIGGTPHREKNMSA